MNTYKITNITNNIAKRGMNHNSVVDITYTDGMNNKTIKLKPGETIYLTLNSLSTSIRKLMVKQLINVSEISQNHLNALMNPEPIKKIDKKIPFISPGVGIVENDTVIVRKNRTKNTEKTTEE